MDPRFTQAYQSEVQAARQQRQIEWHILIGHSSETESDGVEQTTGHQDGNSSSGQNEPSIVDILAAFGWEERWQLACFLKYNADFLSCGNLKGYWRMGTTMDTIYAI